MNAQKKDILILKLIKYLLEDDESFTPQVSDFLSEEPARARSQTNEVGKELQSLKRSVQDLQTEVKKITQNGTSTQASKTNHSRTHTFSNGNGNTSLYKEIVTDALKNAEYRMQGFANGTFLARGDFNDLFLWTTQTSKGVCVIMLESHTNTISANVLNVMVGQLMGELPDELDKIARFINKKIFSFYNKYKNLEQKIAASFIMIDKKAAKIFFTGASMNLHKINDEGKITTNKGLGSYLGIPQNQFVIQNVGIKRGEGLYFTSQSKVDKILKEITDKSLLEKKATLNSWLQKQKQRSAILGLSF